MKGTTEEGSVDVMIEYRCGKHFNETTRFCPECGSSTQLKLFIGDSEYQQYDTKCSQCGLSYVVKHTFV